MESRIMSGVLFLFGESIMALGNLTTFFQITKADFLTVAGMGIIGLILCLMAAYLMLPAPPDDPMPFQRALYALILYCSGVVHMDLGIATIFFHIRPVDDLIAAVAVVGGMALALIACGMAPAHWRDLWTTNRPVYRDSVRETEYEV